MPNDKQDKLTTDLAEGNRAILDNLKEENNWKYGYSINTMISTFGNLPKTVKLYFLSLCKQKLKELNKRMDVAGEFEFKDLEKEHAAYDAIAKFLNNGTRISLEDLKAEPTLKKITLQDGYLICPDDWIVINPEDAQKCLYAGVIECRNGAKYGIPHLLYFCNYRYGRDYPKGFDEMMERKAVSAYPRFKEILAKQVTPIDDPDNPGMMLNADEWMEAPTIGHFAIYVQGDPTRPKDYQPPAGARIVRANVNEDWED
ncbi:hypothetical protein [Butyrivibrio sp. INlla16]|uniref:hypothetical protein n=1 Tax=Butyrivibrio sp. INlla16 TaxID=1520807 RepID=UPI00088FDE8F|nr:hypothetical protein [Butyrivibrio sp. INlla16]SDB68371.1 hypothetical protein SAMN02910263_04165 [Butyrivibrio sp. INlla16]